MMKNGKYQIPTVSIPAKEMIPSYIHIYNKTMNDVYGISGKCKAQILENVKQDYWAANMHYKDWYNKYFKGKEWGWREYDYWLKILNQNNIEPPMRFYVGIDWNVTPDFQEFAKSLTVVEIKKELDSWNIPYKKTAKKPELVSLVIENLRSNLENKYQEYCQKMHWERGEKFFLLLMYTIQFRTSAYRNKTRGEKAGIKKFNISTHNEYLIPIIKKYSSKDSVPPYIPGDDTYLRPVINFKEGRRNLKFIKLVGFLVILMLVMLFGTFFLQGGIL